MYLEIPHDDWTDQKKHKPGELTNHRTDKINILVIESVDEKETSPSTKSANVWTGKTKQ